MESKRITVTGRVQGVGFRAYVASTAAVYGVVGEVWNTRNGDVEIIASAISLDGFLAALKNGPGNISKINAEQREHEGESEFRITATR